MYDDYGQHAQLSESYKSGANWFYWIAALTIVTSVIGLMGVNWRFFLSLGTTQIIDAIANATAPELGNATKVIALVLDIFITAIFVGFGVLAKKKHLWAYVLGMVVFLLDGLLALAIVDWIGVIVHGVVLFLMFRRYQDGREMVALERTMAQSGQTTAEPAPQLTY